MDDDFDIDSAVTEVSSGLGIELTTDVADATGENQGEDASTTSTEGEGAATATDTTATAATKPVPAAGPTPAPSPTALKVPASWRPEAKAEFDKLSPVVQAEVVKREEDILRGIGEYKAAATFGQAVDKAIQPYVPVLRQYGIDPIRHVGELFDIHQRLAMGSPEVKQATLATLARNFGIQLPAEQSSEDSPYMDPEVKTLRTQVEQLQSLHQQLVHQQTQRERQQAEVQQNRIVGELKSELNTFAADPEHAFFDEVANDMAILIQSGRASSLKQAYDLAVRMTPATMEKEALRLQAKQASKKLGTNGAAVAKTTAARNATGVNVKSQAVSPQRKAAAGAGLQNLAGSIEAEYDRITAESKD